MNDRLEQQGGSVEGDSPISKIKRKLTEKIRKIVRSISNYQEIVDFTINEIIRDSSFRWWRDINIEKRLNVAVGYSESYESLEITTI